MGDLNCPKKMKILGVDPEAFWLQIRGSTPELHPLKQNFVLKSLITFRLIGPEQDFNMTNP